MLETNETEVPTSPITRKRHERTEAKFFENCDKVISEAGRLGAQFQPPNQIAKLINLQAKRDAAIAARTAYQAADAIEETKRNARENLYKQLNSNITSLVEYARSAGVPPNDLDALKSISRDAKGIRAKAVNMTDGGKHISVSNLSYASRADNYSRFIEQFDTLGIATEEDFYKAATHRTKLAVLRQSNADVIASESDTSTAGETLDKLAYTDEDSLLKGVISAKSYIRSKFKNDQAYENIRKLVFQMPSRLRP